MLRMMRNTIGLTVVLDLFGLILLFIDGTYSDAVYVVLLFLGTVVVTWLLTIYIEKTAYRVNQKQYQVVMISEKLENWQDIEVRPFEKEEDAFWETGKLAGIYLYAPAEWSEKKGVVPIMEDPTFLIISGNDNASKGKAMRKPIVVTSKPEEVLKFLESHGKARYSQVIRF